MSLWPSKKLTSLSLEHRFLKRLFRMRRLFKLGNVLAQRRPLGSVSPIGRLTKPKTIKQKARRFILWRKRRARRDSG